MAEDSLKPLIEAVIAELKSTGALTAIVGTAIYSDVPQHQTMPYVVVGQQTTQVPFSTKDSDGDDITLTLDVWSDKSSPSETAQIMAAVRNALNRNKAMSVAGHELVDTRFEFGNIAKELDGVSWHGHHRYRVLTIPV